MSAWLGWNVSSAPLRSQHTFWTMSLNLSLSKLANISGDGLVALAIFLSYFLLIGFLFTLIVQSLWRTTSTVDVNRRRAVRLFSFLTALSFAHTWYCESLLLRLHARLLICLLDMIAFLLVRNRPSILVRVIHPG